MVKVLMCGNHPSNKGGMTSVISQIVTYNWEKENIKMKFIPTYYPGNIAIKSLYFCLAYIKIFINFLFWRPDIVHMHMSYKGSFQRKYLIHRLCKLFKVKDVIHLHGSEFEKWYYASGDVTQKKICRLLRECDMFFVLGDKWNTVIKHIEPLTNTIVIRNAIAIPDNIVKWSDKCCQILYLGVLIKRKGVSDLLYALKILKENNRLDGKKIAIAGSGPEEIELKKICKQNELEKYVTFYGWVNDSEKKKLIKESQIFILPSYNEGLPISILEAISYGMPVVATDVGDISSAVNDGQNGYLISPGDIGTLAEKLNDIAQKDSFEKMSYESRKIAENLFSEKNFFHTLQECYFRISR